MSLGALALMVVGATGAFFNDTESSEGNVFTAGTVDLKVDHYFQNYNGNDCEEFCDPVGSDLVTNGNFTNPDIDNGTWDIVSSDDVPGWTVEWEGGQATYEGENRPEPALAEYQDGVNGWDAYDGQWVELDSDWDGPSGSLTGEPASTRITQEIDTTPGTKYRISFAFSPRPGVNNTQNQLEVVWNGAVVDTLSENGGSNTNWQVYTYDVMASGEDTLLEFADVGTPDSAGTFLDAISVTELDCDYTLPGAAQCQLWEETDLNSERFFDFTDIKPGDNGRNGISLHVYDNPAYACLIAHDGEDDENTVFETEGDDDDTAGELQDYITVFTWVDEDQDGLYDPSDEAALDTTTLGELGSIAALDSNNDSFLSPTTTEYIGLAWCAGTIDVDDSTGDISCDGSTMLDDAQSDRFTASLTAFAEQIRHNDTFSCANVELEGEGDNDDGGDYVVASSYSTGFEPDTFTTGNVNGQDGWSMTGPFDVAVVNDPVIEGTQSLRISNAITSGSFGDQTFAPELAAGAGETGVASENRFEAEFEISTTQVTEQSGLAMSVSPDNGEGSRMSYLGFADESGGVRVTFYDVTNDGPLPTGSSFNPVDLGVLDRNSTHKIKFVMEFVDGPANDVVEIYINDSLVHTGTSWEDYYRYDPEQSGNGNQLFPVDTLIFRAAGTAAAGTSGEGFLIDNVNLSSGTI